MAVVRDFRELKVLERGHQLTLLVYKVTQSFPKEELYGLTSQMRRAAASIPSNHAEGCGRNSQVELARFVHIAGGSASELEYQLLLANDLGHLNESNYLELDKELNEIKRMLYSFEKAAQLNRSRSKV